MKNYLIPFVLMFAASCAKTGAPEPPRLLVPRAASDLMAEQNSDSVILRVSPPVQNTDGSAVTTLREMEVFRLAASRDRVDTPLSEDAFLESSDRILIVPAQNLSDYLVDQTLVVRDELSFLLEDLYTQGFYYAVRFVNRKNQTAGLSNQAFIAPVPIPPAPEAISARVSQNRINLNWQAVLQNMDGSTPPRIAGYNVYRGESPDAFPRAPLNSKPLERPEYEDSAFQFERTYYYAVTVVGTVAEPFAESRLSRAVQVVATDTFPPSPPGKLDAVIESGIVILLWVAPPEQDVTGYRVYRTEAGSNVSRSLASGLVTILSFRDLSPQSGKTYCYAVTAVDGFGNESARAEKIVEVP